VDTVRSTTNPSCRLYNGFGIWYKINPFTNNANLFASTCNSSRTNFDTVMTVYQDDNCRPQFCVAQNDDASIGSSGACSTVRFAVSPSTTYWIFVDGFGTGDQGNFRLTVAVA
jgi:hypothetical protein